MVRERIGIYGGAFDPAHLGHLVLASELQYALALDRVLFVPTGDPPHKPATPLTAAHHRVRMIELSIAGCPSFEVNTIDLDRDGPSFTKETLAALTQRYPTAQLIFLMGADSLRDFPNWSDPARILALAELGVARRPGVPIDLAKLLVSLPELEGRLQLVESPLIAISASDIRGRVSNGRPIAFHVVNAVERYIREHRLYLPN